MDNAISKVTGTLYRHRWAASATFLSVIGGTLAFLSTTPRLYTANVRLILDEKPASSISPLGRDLAQAPGETSKALATQEELVRSKKVLTNAVALHQQNHDSNIEVLTVGKVKHNLDTVVIPGTQIIQISFSHEEAETTASLLNLIASSVVQENAESIRSEARATRKFLENQIPQRQQQLANIEAAVSSFKQKYNIVSLEKTDNQLLTQSIADAEKSAEELSARLRQVKARSRSIKDVIGKRGTQETYESTKAGQNPELISLRQKIADLETQLKLKKELLTEEHPELEQILTEIRAAQLLYRDKLATASKNPKDVSEADTDAVTQQLSEKIILSDIERQELEQQLRSTQDYIENLSERRQQYPVLEKRLAALTRQMETAAESVKLLQDKLDDARIAEAQLVSNLRIIEDAEKPSLPSSPNIPVSIILGSVAAILFSTGIVLIIEGLDKTLREPEDIYALTELPILSVIPQQNKSFQKHENKIDYFSNSSLIESFRTLSKNIQIKNNSEARTLIVTSAVSSEGKSFVASNLAIVSAMMSKRTLLIDADTRRPTIHQIFNLSQKPGLQDYLRNEEISAPISSLIHKTSIRNLSVMTVGSYSKYDLFSFEKSSINSLMRNLEGKYENIFIDSPPVMACTDALTLSDDLHQILLVTKLNLTPKSLVKRAINIFQSSNSNIVGVVINGGSLSLDKYDRYIKNDYTFVA